MISINDLFSLIQLVLLHFRVLPRVGYFPQEYRFDPQMRWLHKTNLVFTGSAGGRNRLSAPYNKPAQTVTAYGRSGPTCQNIWWIRLLFRRLYEPSPFAPYASHVVPTHYWSERQVPPTAPCTEYSRKYVMTSGLNVGGARLCKVLARFEIVFLLRVDGEVICRGFIRISVLDVTLWNGCVR